MPQQYELFVEKFKQKKTTDDCYTPELVYNAVRDWVAEEYNLDAEKFVRPFWPGGGYELFHYAKDCIVVDNPPFSMLAKILQFYLQNGIKFFLFAPTKTFFNNNRQLKCCCIAIDVEITYENGAHLTTSFITNLEDTVVRTAPKLYWAVRTANRITQDNKKGTYYTYEYPPEVITATRIGKLNQGDIDFRVSRSEAFSVAALDCQKSQGKGIFGSGFLISREKAEEKVKAEILTEERIALTIAQRAREKREKATQWELSEREIEIVKSLGTSKQE